MIEPVEEIPLTLKEKRESSRAMIRADIQNAIDSGIRKFEFVGDGYNYKYLANYAREEAQIITRKKLRDLWRDEVERVRDAGGYVFPDSFRLRTYIVIHSHKGADRTHVYCEINPDDLTEYAKAEMQRALEDMEKRERK